MYIKHIYMGPKAFLFSMSGFFKIKRIATKKKRKRKIINELVEIKTFSFRYRYATAIPANGTKNKTFFFIRKLKTDWFFRANTGLFISSVIKVKLKATTDIEINKSINTHIGT